MKVSFCTCGAYIHFYIIPRAGWSHNRNSVFVNGCNSRIVFDHVYYFAFPLGHFFQPLPCPFCFHSCIKAGIFSMACLLISRRPFKVLSHSFPLTFCPSPVPLTCSPLSTLLRSFSPGFLMVQGSKSTTPCTEASLTRSACFRRPKAGDCHRPVVKFLCGRKGLG